MKKIICSCLVVLLLFLFSGCEFFGEKVSGTFGGIIGRNNATYYVLNKDGKAEDLFFFYLDDNSTVYDIEGNIAPDVSKTMSAAYERYSLRVIWDESLTKEFQMTFGDNPTNEIAYYASKVEFYLEVPDGYAVCEIHNSDTVRAYDFTIKKAYEIGKPWTIEATDCFYYGIPPYSFHVSSFYLDEEKTICATYSTFSSFPEDGITLYVEKTEDVTGQYVSENDGSLLTVAGDTFTFINGEEEITYQYKQQYHQGSYYVILDESNEVIATFNFTFTNLENFISIRYEAGGQESIYNKQP